LILLGFPSILGLPYVKICWMHYTRKHWLPWWRAVFLSHFGRTLVCYQNSIQKIAPDTDLNGNKKLRILRWQLCHAGED
jgi:hypothetical protein